LKNSGQTEKQRKRRQQIVGPFRYLGPVNKTANPCESVNTPGPGEVPEADRPAVGVGETSATAPPVRAGAGARVATTLVGEAHVGGLINEYRLVA
jgi:hypothetical protein